MNKESIEEILRGRQPGVLGSEDMVRAAVAVPLVEKDGHLHLLFEVRSQHLKRQPGEICFPGGRLEPGDRDPSEAAVRETCEELGLSPDRIRVLGALDILVNPWRSIIYPFVCHITSGPIHINEEEVEEVFAVPLEYLKQHTPEVHHIHLEVRPEETFPFERIPGGRQYPWSRGRTPEYFYIYEGYVIWGLTARILKHFLDVATRR